MQGHEFDWNDSYSGKADDYEAPDSQLIEVIGDLLPGRALDIGCGAGGLVVALAERGWQVTGIDLATKAIAAAQAVMKTRSIDAELQVADATTWRPSGKYNLITSSFALPGDKAGRAKVFAMMRSALAPGGAALLKDFDASMTRHNFFASFDLVTTEELASGFAGFEMVRNEIVKTPAHTHGDNATHDGEIWTAALLYARKPGSTNL